MPNLFPFKEIYCPNCQAELVLSLEERRNKGQIQCPQCKTTFFLNEALSFIEKNCVLFSGDCPSCGTSLDFDYEFFSVKKSFKCPECEDDFYINEVVNPEVQLIYTDMNDKRINFKISVKGIRIELAEDYDTNVYKRLLISLYIEYTLRQLCNIVEDDNDGHLIFDFMTHNIVEKEISDDPGSKYFKGFVETRGTSIPLFQMNPVGYGAFDRSVVKDAVISIYTLQSFLISQSTENIDYEKVIKFINNEIGDHLSMTSDTLSHTILGTGIYIKCLKKFFGEEIVLEEG